MRLLTRGIGVTLLSFVVCNGTGTQRPTCPPGMTMGGKQCEYTNLCPDGRPMGKWGCSDVADGDLPRRQCEREVIFEPQRPGALYGRRQILLVNGPLDSLIRSYANESGRLGIHVNWQQSQIIYVAEREELRTLKVENAAVSPRLGRNAFSITVDAANGVVSKNLPDPEVVRAHRKFDLRCGPVRD